VPLAKWLVTQPPEGVLPTGSASRSRASSTLARRGSEVQIAGRRRGMGHGEVSLQSGVVASKRGEVAAQTSSAYARA
jgi:hypothetical protein